jgi:hypothetical protein
MGGGRSPAALRRDEDTPVRGETQGAEDVEAVEATESWTSAARPGGLTLDGAYSAMTSPASAKCRECPPPSPHFPAPNVTGIPAAATSERGRIAMRPPRGRRRAGLRQRHRHEVAFRERATRDGRSRGRGPQCSRGLVHEPPPPPAHGCGRRASPAHAGCECRPSWG